MPDGFERYRAPDIEIAFRPGTHAARVVGPFSRHVRLLLREIVRRVGASPDCVTSPAPIVVLARDQAADDGSVEASGDPVTGVVTVTLTESIPALGLARELTYLILHRMRGEPCSADVLERSVSVTEPRGLDYLLQGVARAAAADIDAVYPFSAAPGGGPTADDICRKAGAESQWQLPIYECMVGGPEHAPSTAVYWAMAESFGRYLLARDGRKNFAEFVRESAGGDISYASAVAYGKYFDALKEEWVEAQLRLRRGRRPVTWTQFLGRSLPYFRPYPALVVGCVALVFIVSALAQYTPFAFRDILDTIPAKEINNEPFEPFVGFAEAGAGVFGAHPDELNLLKTVKAVRLVLSLFVVNIITLGSQILLIYWVNVLGQNVLRDLRYRYVDRVNGLSASNFNRTSTGDLQARFLSDMVRLADPMTQIICYSTYHIIFLLSTTVAMFFLAWQLTLVLLACLPLYFFIAGWLGPKLQAATRTRQERLAQLNSDLKQMVDAHPLIQIGNLQHFLRRRAEPGIEHSRRVEIRSDFYTGLFAETVGITDQFFQKSVLLVGAILGIWAGLTVGTISAFLTQTGRGIARLHSLMNIYRHIAIAAAALQRVEEVLAFNVEPLDDAPTPVPARPRQPSGRQSGSVRFDGVWFTYNGVDPILRDVSLTIPAGGNVAFVGPTGAGKTTLVNMVPRFYEPTQGKVFVDGRDTREYGLSELRSQIGLVSQDTFLFNMSIRENIGLGKLGASDEEIEAAAKAARIHDFIVSLPAGYHTLVGERGSRLSGGQRQRLAVARALLRNPSILILDEATSALDAETEREILEELDEVTKDKTTISITHRLALAMRAQRIYVIDGGRIVEEGTHDELMERNGLYRKLFEDQNELILASLGVEPTSNGAAGRVLAETAAVEAEAPA